MSQIKHLVYYELSGRGPQPVRPFLRGQRVKQTFCVDRDGTT
ncbi:hypothetical protein FHT28_004091 [Rhizobium sp. SG570]|nr:hypothetical protein [Rhizobium sp. SG570]